MKKIDKTNLDKKRILFFCGNLTHFGGTEKATINLSNELVNRGYDILLVSLCGGGTLSFDTDERIKVEWLQSKSLKSDIASNLKKLKGICKSFQPDFWIDVDSILVCYSALIGMTNKNIRFISWEHFAHDMQFDVNPMIRKITGFYASHSTRFLVVLSEDDKRALEKKASKKCRVVNIPNSIPSMPVSNTEKQKVVLAAGNLVDVKGFDRLLGIWNKVEKRCPDWELFIAGDGICRKDLEEQSRELKLKNCKFLGLHESVWELFDTASILAVSSHKEGFPMVCLEAFSFGNPVVAFDVSGGLRELVRNDFNGYLIPEGELEVEAYENCLCELMLNEEKRRDLSENAKDFAKDFAVEQIADRWETLFAEEMEI